MFWKPHRRTRLVLSLVLLAIGAGAAAQNVPPYQGDQFCGLCHKDHPNAWMNKYDDYIQHGHRWIETPTKGAAPGPDLFGLASVLDEHGNPISTLSDPTTIKKSSGGFATWEDVRAVLGAYRSGGGSFVMSNGQRVSAGGTWNTAPSYTNYTKRCFRCHNPTDHSDVATPDDDRIMYGTDANAWRTRVQVPGSNPPEYQFLFNGAPAKDPFGNRIGGIQCEHCHGPAGQMLNGAAIDRKICMDCHATTSGDPVAIGGDPEYRIQATLSADGKTVTFPGHRPQGNEFRRSAHKAVRAKLKTQGAGTEANAKDVQYVEQGCVLCHDPHKSVWHKKGGIKYVEDPTNEEEVGNMCAACHQKTDRDADFPADQKPKKVRLRGIMGEVGLLCVDCHMPYVSVLGEEPMHLFRMWTGPDKLSAPEHVSEVIDGKRWWTSTDRDGDAYMALDLVCTTCHDINRMPLDFMARYAKGIHRQPGLVDLTVNNSDSLTVVGKNDLVSVDFSVECGDKYGVKADWWVICQGPKGWSSWNGKKWAAGLRPWRKKAALADVEQNVLKAKLRPGHYTYWTSIYPTDGSENYDSVPVYVRKK